MDSWKGQILDYTKKHPGQNIIVSYGTAGFRTLASRLDHICFRVGILAVLRSKFKNAAVGVMITASHNPVQDNGVKIIDPHGEMLEQSWETYATELGNSKDEEFMENLEKVIKSLDIDLSIPSTVLVGMDTRPSSTPLCNSVKDGINCLNGNCKDFGLLTTPQLHYIVNQFNSDNRNNANEEGYYNHFCGAVKDAMSNNSSNPAKIVIDCANGVGAPKMKIVSERIKDFLDIDLINDGSGELNKNCGADFVKVQQAGPKNIELKPGIRYVSFDGDADRIVYYIVNSEGKFVLLDGDKMASLIAVYFQNTISEIGLKCSIGVVQTAYANGSATNYLRDVLKVPVACTKTGVKHLHHKAQDFDIGIYFEPNGHGTVLVKSSVIEEVTKLASSNKKAAEFLSVIKIINQTVGDSICDMLLTEAILDIKQWSAEDWNNLYAELPNRQTKVKVQDRNAIKTANEEREVTEPKGLQNAVDEIVKKYPNGRSFVRPSGTEDVVRVYAESNTQKNADDLAKEVGEAVEKFT